MYIQKRNKGNINREGLRKERDEEIKKRRKQGRKIKAESVKISVDARWGARDQIKTEREGKK